MVLEKGTAGRLIICVSINFCIKGIVIEYTVWYTNTYIGGGLVVYVCKQMKLYIDGCILSFIEKRKTNRYTFIHTVISDDGLNDNFEVVCDAPKVSSPDEGITMEIGNTSVVSGYFDEELKKITFPYGSVFKTDNERISFGVSDSEGNKHWYSYVPISF